MKFGILFKLIFNLIIYDIEFMEYYKVFFVKDNIY